jgi:hypothetical protein
MWGTQECYSCFEQLYQSADTCSTRGACAQAPATTAFCLGNDLATGMYRLNGSAMAAVGQQCPGLAGAAFGTFLPGRSRS